MKNLLTFAAMGAVLIVGGNAHGKCASATILEELGQAERKGEQAFADMDLEVLRTHAKAARAIVPCLSEVVTSKHAAAFHRLMALDAFTYQKDDQVIAEFHAARKLDAGYRFPDTVADADHPLRKLYKRAAGADEGELQNVYPPKGGYVRVGGVRNAPRGKLTPVIIQVFSRKGKILETRYVKAGESLGKLGEDPRLKIKIPPPVSGWEKPNNWYYTALATGAAAAILYGVAMHQKSKFDDTDTPDGELEGYRTRANALGYSSIALGSLGLIATGVGVTFSFSFGGDDDGKKVSFEPINSTTNPYEGVVRVRR